MDGTIYLENELIDGALEFINSLIKAGKDYVFMTNNSSKSADAYLNKLHSLNIPAGKDNIFTSGQAACIYLDELKKGAKIYTVGTKSLKDELHSHGFEVLEKPEKDIDFLLVGYDTELNYEKLTFACELLDDGIPFFATNPDIVCPAKKGRYLPDCATICYMLEKATGKTPFYIGKPRKEMAILAAGFKNTNLNNTALVGDRLYTDIKCGLNAGIFSILVLSGESTRDDIEKFNIHPDLVVESVKELIIN
ncbi:MAG: family hydrolase [Clostridia bacterium]|jgi:HAD superfamily hydrolase (TIGR01450 family)|nr:family hydrolase [Clostridia bacterium]